MCPFRFLVLAFAVLVALWRYVFRCRPADESGSSAREPAVDPAPAAPVGDVASADDHDKLL